MMNCKNCNLEIDEPDSFCKKFGAKIVKDRITIKSLFSSLLITLGWDSSFIITLRYLIYQPLKVLREYLNGTRKKYTNPFTFLAIVIAVSLFIFNQYSEQIIKLNTDILTYQTELIVSSTVEKTEKINDVEEFRFREKQQEIMKFHLKYYNLISFLLLPIISLIAFIVFGKPYNYGEHLVINTYIQSITTMLSVLLFAFSIIIGINLLGTASLILTFFYYCFIYKKLNKLTFSQLILKTLKFLGIFIITTLIVFLIGYIVGSKS